MNMNALQTHFYEFITYVMRITDVKYSCEFFTEVKDSHVCVTSVKISH